MSACGGSQEAGGDKLVDLDQAELAAACGALDSQALGDPEVIAGLCRIRGATRAELDSRVVPGTELSTCEMDTAACMASPRVAFCPGEVSPSCATTVDELRSCARLVQAQWRRAAPRTCEEEFSHVQNLVLSGASSEDPETAACLDAQKGCFIVLPAFAAGAGAPPPGAAGGTGAGGSVGGVRGAGAPSAGTGGTSGAGSSSLPPDPACMATYPTPQAACAECVCRPQEPAPRPDAGCLELYQSCFENLDPEFAMRCGAMIGCMLRVG
jgi:hypothetical protein